MSGSNSNNNRKQVGLWFLGLLGAIASVMGIRYASSAGLWSNMLNRDKLVAYQTINTGASVPILALDSGEALPVGGSDGTLGGTRPQPSSLQGNGEEISGSSPRRGRW